MVAVLAVIIILVVLGLSLLSQFTGNISGLRLDQLERLVHEVLGHTLSPMTGVLILTNMGRYVTMLMPILMCLAMGPDSS